MSPLDILFIVLAFCVLWLSAALFWLVWQVASILRNVNDTLAEARDKMTKIEMAISGIKNRFESMVSPASILMDGVKSLVEYAMEKRARRRESMMQDSEE